MGNDSTHPFLPVAALEAAAAVVAAPVLSGRRIVFAFTRVCRRGRRPSVLVSIFLAVVSRILLGDSEKGCAVRAEWYQSCH